VRHIGLRSRGLLGPGPFELDVLGGHLPSGEALVEVDSGQRRQDRRTPSRPRPRVRALEVFDLPVDAVQALLEIGDGIVLGPGRGRRGAKREGRAGRKIRKRGAGKRPRWIPSPWRREKMNVAKTGQGLEGRPDCSHPLFYNTNSA